MFPIKNGLKEGDALLSLLFNFALEYANQKLLKLNGTHNFRVCKSVHYHTFK